MTNTYVDSSEIIAPPPALYLGAFLLGFLVHVTSPLSLLSLDTTRWAIGTLLLIISGAFARWAFVTMHNAGTSANPYKPSTSLIITGPFHLSRNPIYVAMTGLYIGMAFWVNSSWPLLLLAPLLLLMHYGVILREERYLSKKFGEIYAVYKAEVRRWL